MRLPFALLLLSACAAPGSEGPSHDQEALRRALAERQAGTAETCVSNTPSQSLTIVDNRTLSYERGGTVWVNRLEAECPGMQPLDTIIIEVQGSQYCRSDRFRVVEAGSSIPGPYCRLGNFVPYRRP